MSLENGPRQIGDDHVAAIADRLASSDSRTWILPDGTEASP